MDVCAKTHGFLAVLVCDGEEFCNPWASGRKGQECPQRSLTAKTMFMFVFLPYKFI